ncbi:MAG: ATP-binding cassette domain-containing protein [bacterium]
MQPAIVIENLTHFYGERPALQEVGFSVSAGEVFGILGPNGSGKTTLFRILSTLFPPQQGRAKVLGYDCARAARHVRAKVGVVFQSPSLDVKLTVFENLKHHGHLWGLRGDDLLQRIDAALQDFDLSERRHDLAEKLSGGLRRRVELAKVLLSRPPILLLDEPSTGLDPGARRDFWQILESLRTTESTTILLTTHLLEEAESCERLAILDQGRLVALGSPSELKARIGGEVIWVKSAEPAEFRKQLYALLRIKSALVEGMIRIEQANGYELVPKLNDLYAPLIESISVSKPTLEDVFIKETGHKFWSEDKHD